MNIVQAAVTAIFSRIPIEILEIGFIHFDPSYESYNVSLEEKIINKVIRPVVIKDTNIAGGQIIPVNTSGLSMQLIDAYSLLVEIPPDRVNNRTILEALSASYIPEGSHQYGQFPMLAQAGMNKQGSDISAAGQRLFSSHASIPVQSTSHLELVGTNTVMIRDQSRISGIYSIRVLVGNEENLSNLPIKVYQPFTKLCEHAVKAYLFNFLRVKVDRQYLLNGQPLGSIKELIDEYRDSQEMYETFLKEQWGAIAYLADPVRRDRLIKMQLPANL